LQASPKTPKNAYDAGDCHGRWRGSQV